MLPLDPPPSKPAPPRAWTFWRLVRALASALALGALVSLLWTAWNHELVTAWMREAGPIPFFTAMAILPVIGVPITPLFLLAGAIFGTFKGLVGSLLALAVNLWLSHWIATSGLRPRLERLLRRFDYQLPDFRGAQQNALRFSLLVKLAPGLPAFAKNYLLGLSGVPMPVYFAVGMVVTGVYGALIVVLGESLLAHDLRQGALAALILALIAAVLAWLWRTRSRAA
jgi:uncharacterized membrane protein YdjX (TVP38/TMEM64 family)